jgi:hypothetical protein
MLALLMLPQSDHSYHISSLVRKVVLRMRECYGGEYLFDIRRRVREGGGSSWTTATSNIPRDLSEFLVSVLS